MSLDDSFNPYLAPTYFINSDHPKVIELAQQSVGQGSTIDKAIRLYLAVRDGFLYDPYTVDPHLRQERFTASFLIESGRGFCGPKAVLLAAVARVVGIPSRLGFADVVNHLATQELLDLLQTKVFYFHTYTELYLEDKWVKCTPAFNLSLCQKFNLHPLEFDGRNDSLFHEYSADDQKFMEYLHDYGQFADFPFDLMVEVLTKNYPGFPKIFAKKYQQRFEDETPV